MPCLLSQSRSAVKRASSGSTEGPQTPVEQHMGGSKTRTVGITGPFGKRWLRGVESATLRLAALAAVFPDVVGERAYRGKLGCVVVEGAFASHLQEIGVDQALQVMAQCRRWKVDVLLDLERGRPLGAALDYEAKNRQASRVPESAELLGVSIELRGHPLLLTNSNHAASLFFETFRRTRRVRLSCRSNGMATYRVPFDDLPWQTSPAGVLFKTHRIGGSQLRLLVIPAGAMAAHRPRHCPSA